LGLWSEANTRYDFWATVCETVRPLLSDRCLSVCLSVLSCLCVTLVYCGQTVRWIKMKLRMQVGLGPGDLVLDGDLALPFPKKGRSPLPNFRPMSIVAKQLDGSRRNLVGGGPWSRPHCARWRPSSPPKKWGRAPPQFSAHFYRVVQEKPHKVWCSIYFLSVDMLSSVIHHTIRSRLLVRMPHCIQKLFSSTGFHKIAQCSRLYQYIITLISIEDMPLDSIL